MPRYPSFTSNIAQTLGQESALVEQKKRRKSEERMGLARLALGAAQAIGEAVPQYYEAFGLGPRKLDIEEDRSKSYARMAEAALTEAAASKLRAEKGVPDIYSSDPLTRAEAVSRLAERAPGKTGMIPKEYSKIVGEVRAGPEIGPTERSMQRWERTWGGAFPGEKGYTPSVFSPELLSQMSPEEILAMGVLARLYSEPSSFSDVAGRLLSRYEYGAGAPFTPGTYPPTQIPEAIKRRTVSPPIGGPGLPGEHIEVTNQAQIEAARELNRRNELNRIALENLLRGAGRPSTTLARNPSFEELKQNEQYFRELLQEILSQRNIESASIPLGQRQ